MTVIVAFWTRRGQIKHGYCSNNHTYDHLLIRNIWLRKTYKVQNTTAFSFSMHTDDPCSNSSCVPTSLSQSNKETRRNARAGKRTQSCMWGAWGMGSTFSRLQEVIWWLFDVSPDEPTSMRRKATCLIWAVALHGDKEKWPWGKGGRSAFEPRSWGMASLANSRSSLLPQALLPILLQKPPCLSLKGEEKQWRDQAEICPACPSSIPTWAKF